ncbi:MAG: urease accessory protein UreD, partial [Polyangiales bacterium]
MAEFMVSGSGALRFFARGHKTHVARVRAQSPLKLIPTRGGDTAWVFTTTFGGGLVDGDAIDLSVEVEPHARALLTTQASTKIHRSPSGTESSIRARVDEGALLAIVSDPVVAYAQARYAQKTCVTLAGGSLAYVDVLTAGRVARGERWAFARVSSELAIEGALHDAVLLDPEHGDLPSRMGRFDAIATLVLAGPLTADARARIGAEIAETRVRAGDPCVEAASTRGELLLLRIAAIDVATMQARVRDRLRETLALLRIDPFARK